jgi:threonine/homoserine/homoserine lactone efflux protein
MDCLIFVSFITGLVFGPIIWVRKPSWRWRMLIIAGLYMIVLGKYTPHADPKDIGNNAWLLDILPIAGGACLAWGILKKNSTS